MCVKIFMYISELRKLKFVVVHLCVILKKISLQVIVRTFWGRVGSELHVYTKAKERRLTSISPSHCHTSHSSIFLYVSFLFSNYSIHTNVINYHWLGKLTKGLERHKSRQKDGRCLQCHHDEKQWDFFPWPEYGTSIFI